MCIEYLFAEVSVNNFLFYHYEMFFYIYWKGIGRV